MSFENQEDALTIPSDSGVSKYLNKKHLELRRCVGSCETATVEVSKKGGLPARTVAYFVWSTGL